MLFLRQWCSRRTSDRATSAHEKVYKFLFKVNKTAPFLGYVHMDIYFNVNSINLSSSMLTGLEPTHSWCCAFLSACISELSRDLSFRFRISFSAPPYVFIDCFFSVFQMRVYYGRDCPSQKAKNKHS